MEGLLIRVSIPPVKLCCEGEGNRARGAGIQQGGPSFAEVANPDKRGTILSGSGGSRRSKISEWGTASRSKIHRMSRIGGHR